MDKIGTPGKRTVNDLLEAFKVIKNPAMKKSTVEQLEDASWIEEVMDMEEEPDTEIPSESRGT